MRSGRFAEWPHKWKNSRLHQHTFHSRDSTRSQDAFLLAEPRRLMSVLGFEILWHFCIHCTLLFLYGVFSMSCGVWEAFSECIQWCALAQLKDGEERKGVGSIPCGDTVLPVWRPPSSSTCESWFCLRWFLVSALIRKYKWRPFVFFHFFKGS